MTEVAFFCGHGARAMLRYRSELALVRPAVSAKETARPMRSGRLQEHRAPRRGVKAVLTNHVAGNNGQYETPPTKWLRSAGCVYPGSDMAQPFRSHEVRRSLNRGPLKDFLVACREGFFVRKNANNLPAMLESRQHGDVNDNPVLDGDFRRALGMIEAEAVVTPRTTGLYFPLFVPAI